MAWVGKRKYLVSTPHSPNQQCTVPSFHPLGNRIRICWPSVNSLSTLWPIFHVAYFIPRSIAVTTHIRSVLSVTPAHYLQVQAEVVYLVLLIITGSVRYCRLQFPKDWFVTRNFDLCIWRVYCIRDYDQTKQLWKNQRGSGIVADLCQHCTQWISHSGHMWRRPPPLKPPLTDDLPHVTSVP